MTGVPSFGGELLCEGQQKEILTVGPDGGREGRRKDEEERKRKVEGRRKVGRKEKQNLHLGMKKK